MLVPYIAKIKMVSCCVIIPICSCLAAYQILNKTYLTYKNMLKRKNWASFNEKNEQSINILLHS